MKPFVLRPGASVCSSDSLIPSLLDKTRKAGCADTQIRGFSGYLRGSRLLDGSWEDRLLRSFRT